MRAVRLSVRVYGACAALHGNITAEYRFIDVPLSIAKDATSGTLAKAINAHVSGCVNERLARGYICGDLLYYCCEPEQGKEIELRGWWDVRAQQLVRYDVSAEQALNAFLTAFQTYEKKRGAAHRRSRYWRDLSQMAATTHNIVTKGSRPKTDYIYRATFYPQIETTKGPVATEPLGRQSWDATEFVLNPPGDVTAGYFHIRNGPGEVFVDIDDVLIRDPSAPKWVRNWEGPFVAILERVEKPKKT